MKPFIQLWQIGVVGYLFALAGFVLIVREWVHVFNTQGNTLARDQLRDYLHKWRMAEDAEFATAADTRAAIVRKMQEVSASITDSYQQRLLSDYANQLIAADPANAPHLDDLDRAFAVGSAIEDEERRPRRRRLMMIGTVLVILGTVGQAISTLPKPFGPFCKSEDWMCPRT